jgi:hypothetical protein
VHAALFQAEHHLHARAQGPKADPEGQPQEPPQRRATERAHDGDIVVAAVDERVNDERALLGVVGDEPGPPEQAVPINDAEAARDGSSTHPFEREPEGVAHGGHEQAALEAL